MSTIWAACNSLVLGLGLLYICIFTLTIPHPSLIYLRLAIAPLAILNFWNFGYGSYQPPALIISSAMAAIGIYGVMRVLEHSIVGLWDPTPPHWVARAGQNAPRHAHPLPGSFEERCFYAFDLLTSPRGASWSKDRDWNWIPRRLQSWTSAPSRQFIMDGVKAMVTQYLLLDLLDTITKSRRWNTRSPYPISSLSLLEQAVFAMCICGGAFLLISFGYTVTSTACVLCGSSPDSWPPVFDSPYASTSLSDFWAYRWHWIFRRVFDRLSMPLVCVMMSIIRLGGKDLRKTEYIVSAIRATIIFGLSTLLHLCIMYRTAQSEYRKNYGMDSPFWDPGTLMFFMAQPFGLFIESTVIIRVADWMFPSQDYLGDCQQHSDMLVYPPRIDVNQDGVTGDLKPTESRPDHRWQRMALTRLYAWIFLIWTGRWWADTWVHVGFFGEDEIAMPFSILRGFWRGKW